MPRSVWAYVRDNKNMGRNWTRGTRPRTWNVGLPAPSMVCWPSLSVLMLVTFRYTNCWFSVTRILNIPLDDHNLVMKDWRHLLNLCAATPCDKQNSRTSQKSEHKRSHYEHPSKMMYSWRPPVMQICNKSYATRANLSRNASFSKYLEKEHKNLFQQWKMHKCLYKMYHICRNSHTGLAMNSKFRQIVYLQKGTIWLRIELLRYSISKYRL